MSKRLAKLWTESGAAIFSADRVLAINNPRVTVTLHHKNKRFLVIVWRPDKSVIDDPPHECIAGGGYCKATGPLSAAVEAVRMLHALYPIGGKE